MDPHLITYDLSIIATSDVNKPLLRSAIPVLIKGLKLRGTTNYKLVNDVVKILLQLTYDKPCTDDLMAKREEFLPLLKTLIVPPHYDLESRLAAQNLYNILEPAPVAQTESRERASVADDKGKTGGTRLGGLLKKAISAQKASTDAKQVASQTAERRKSTTAAPTDGKHVMLSYNWDIKPIVRRVDELLRANGIKTWLDE